MNRIGMKIACLAAAILIWIQVASTTVSEADLRLPVEVVNVPAGLVVSGLQHPQVAVVRMRAAKLRVIAHKYLHRSLGRIELDFANRQVGVPFLYEITPADVRTAQEVVAVLRPSRLPLRLEPLDDQRLTAAGTSVRVVGDVMVVTAGAQGRDVAVSPGSCDVTIEGPADSVRALRAEDLHVVVDVSRVHGDQPRVPGRVVHPGWVMRATVAPATFAVLAGKGRPE